jgi:hypothetical protein
MTKPARNLVVIVCGAGPAPDVGELVKLAQKRLSCLIRGFPEAA